MAEINTVGIISKPNTPRAGELVTQLLDHLAERGVDVRLDIETARYAGRPGGLHRDDVPDGVQLVIVLGGDGTLLAAARAIAGREIPLFAVNLGGLGFLTAITVDELFPELERAFRGQHRIAHRHVLHCELWRHGRRTSQWQALNDAVVTKGSMARMIDLECYVDKHFVCAYKADGLIVTTPTGSTAYSLAAGGPIVFPKVSAFCITPICPHMLNNRPVIVPDDLEIRIVNRAPDRESHLTMDGQVGEALCRDDVVVCTRSDKAVWLVRPPKQMFFDVLRAKLSWGER